MWAVLTTRGGFATHPGLPVGQEIHEAVGGYFEIVRIQHDILMWLNEEGKLVGLPMNYHATALAWLAGAISTGDWIAGDVVFTGTEDKHGNHQMLTGAQHVWLEGVLVR